MEIEKLNFVKFHVHNFYMQIQFQIYVDNQLNVRLDSLLMILKIYVFEYVHYYNKLMVIQDQDDV